MIHFSLQESDGREGKAPNGETESRETKLHVLVISYIKK